MMFWILYALVGVLVAVAYVVAMYKFTRHPFGISVADWMMALIGGVCFGIVWPVTVSIAIIGGIFYVPARYLSKRFP